MSSLAYKRGALMMLLRSANQLLPPPDGECGRSHGQRAQRGRYGRGAVSDASGASMFSFSESLVLPATIGLFGIASQA